MLYRSTITIVLVCLWTNVAAGDDAEIGALGPTARKNFEQGITSLGHSEWEQAVLAFTGVIDEHPNFSPAYEHRARALKALESQAESQAAKDQFALRYMRDEQKVLELRAERRTAKLLKEQQSNPYSFLVTVGAFVAYAACWIWLGVVWSRQSRPQYWVVLGFLLGGPIALVLLAIIALRDSPTKHGGEKPFEDSPLEMELAKRQPSTSSEPFVEAEVTSCPNCGREIAVTTKVCPRCETRLQ